LEILFWKGKFLASLRYFWTDPLLIFLVPKFGVAFWNQISYLLFPIKFIFKGNSKYFQWWLWAEEYIPKFNFTYFKCLWFFKFNFIPYLSNSALLTIPSCWWHCLSRYKWFLQSYHLLFRPFDFLYRRIFRVWVNCMDNYWLIRLANRWVQFLDQLAECQVIEDSTKSKMSAGHYLPA